MAGDGPQQLQQRRGGIEVTAVRAEVHSRQRAFLEPGRSDTPNLGHDPLLGHALRQSPGARNDAVGAGFRAAGLDAQGECRAAGETGLNRRATTAFSVAEPLRARQSEIADLVDEARLVGIADHANDVGQLANLFGTPRRVAAGHDDSRGGVGASHAPDGLSRPLIGGGGHRAGVHDDEISLLGGDGDRPGRLQLFLEAERVRLVHTAAEGDDGILHKACRSVIDVMITGSGYFAI